MYAEKLTLESDWDPEGLFTRLNTVILPADEVALSLKEFADMLELIVPIFGKAKAEIMALLANDNFHRWKESKEYRDCMAGFKSYSCVEL